MNKAHKAKGEKRRRNTARRSSETRLRRRSALIFAAAVFLVIAVPLVLWIRLHDAVVSSAALAALLAMLALLVCIRRQHLRYDDDLLEDLALLTENIIGADSLGYLRTEGLQEMAGELELCRACFDSCYPCR